MEYLAKRMADFILEQKVIEEEDYAIYKYGLQTGMEMSLCVIVSAIIAIILDSFLEYLVLMLMFFPLRAYVGGIHMKSFRSCFVCSCVVLTLGLCFAMKCTLDGSVMILPICILMFVNHKLAYRTTARQTDEEDVKFYALQRRKILIVLCICLLIFQWLGLERWIALMLYMLVVIFGSVMLEIVLDIKNG